jgi:hypothetical protein
MIGPFDRLVWLSYRSNQRERARSWGGESSTGIGRR